MDTDKHRWESCGCMLQGDGNGTATVNTPCKPRVLTLVDPNLCFICVHLWLLYTGLNQRR